MSYPAALEDLFEEGRFAVRGAVRFNFGDGPYGVWNGTGPLDIGGLVYAGSSLLEVEDPSIITGTQAIPLEISLPESADYGLTPDVLATIDDEDYKGRTVIVYDLYFEPDTRELLHAEALYKGYVDYIQHVRDAQGRARLVGHVETQALDNHRDGFRTASDADQQLVSAGDRFFEYASLVRVETFEYTLPG